jgi:hypothetical protein
MIIDDLRDAYRLLRLDRFKRTTLEQVNAVLKREVRKSSTRWDATAPEWWTGYERNDDRLTGLTMRLHPTRQITVALARPASAEVIAKAWFATLVKDIRRQRAMMRFEWEYRVKQRKRIDPWVEAVRAAVRGDEDAAYRRTRLLVNRCRELRLL